MTDPDSVLGGKVGDTASFEKTVTEEDIGAPRTGKL